MNLAMLRSVCYPGQGTLRKQTSMRLQHTHWTVSLVFDAGERLTSCGFSKQMNANQMRHTAGHELGHMFGLDDVNTVGMLMGPLDLRRPVSKPNPTEIETVQAIREECESIVAKADSPHGHHFVGYGSCDEHEHHQH